ncbi:hypothetical protein [Natronorubrum halophilum]|uniref:hypothetical protein n=1 Tax=Natronorubrum halophilum TaxID=1702106 RepID=UPI001EE87CC1|nr:hypothetical protein [Natronorubrum halophilum]
MFYRTRFAFAKAIALAICEPQLRLGRRRHDNYCDECGEHCDPYAMDKLDFPIESLEPEATSSTEKVRAMVNAEYVRVCLECSVDLEADDNDDREVRTDGGAVQTETVYVPKYSSRKKVFHTDSDCRYLTDSTQDWSREMAEAWDLRECKLCSGDHRLGANAGNRLVHSDGENSTRNEGGEQ